MPPTPSEQPQGPSFRASDSSASDFPPPDLLYSLPRPAPYPFPPNYPPPLQQGSPYAPPFPPNGRSLTGVGGPPPAPDTRMQLHVANLPYRVRWQDLKDLMRKCGTVLRADVALTPLDGRSRGFGVVLFARAEDAHKAIEVYNGYSWQTRTLDVRPDTSDPTGALAIAEANRQTAMQQQGQNYQQLPTLPYPPPPWQGPIQSIQDPQFLPPVSTHSPFSVTNLVPHPNSTSHISLSSPSSPAILATQPPSVQGSQRRISPSLVPGLPPPPLPVDLVVPLSSASRPSSDVGSAVEERQAAGISTRGDSQADASSASDRYAQQQGQPQQQQQLQQQQQQQQQQHQHQHQQQFQQQQFQQQQYQQQQQQQVFAAMQMGMVTMPGFQSFPGAGQGYQGLPPNMHGGMMQQYQPQRTQPNAVPPQFTNRHIFVGNLPFNCQWQELKDLMRSAGAVLRADIAQGPDGRSRGFGSVLFSSPADAERAVQMFNGYDYNGRALKVHFDKFSGTPSGQPSPSSVYAQQPQPSFVAQNPYDLGYRDQRQQPSYYSQEPPPPMSTRPSRPPSPDGVKSTSAAPSTAPSTTSSPLVRAQASPPTRITLPSRIAMPPPYPFAGPLSPVHGRLPLMTPSMPAFTLGAFPQTPPLYPQFFSPGLGPFSPPMGSPYFGPGPGHHFMNPAPGAPVHRQGSNDYNPMFPSIPEPASEPSYFPVVPPPASSSTPSAPTPTTSSAPPSGPPTTRSSPSTIARSLVSTPTGPDALALGLANLRMDGSAKKTLGESGGRASPPVPAGGWASGLDAAGAGGAEGGPRRNSFVTGAAGADERATAFDIRRRFEGEKRERGGRRASFEDKRPRPAFGTSSIWATDSVE